MGAKELTNDRHVSLYVFVPVSRCGAKESWPCNDLLLTSSTSDNESLRHKSIYSLTSDGVVAAPVGYTSIHQYSWSIGAATTVSLPGALHPLVARKKGWYMSPLWWSTSHTKKVRLFKFIKGVVTITFFFCPLFGLECDISSVSMFRSSTNCTFTSIIQTVDQAGFCFQLQSAKTLPSWPNCFTYFLAHWEHCA